MVPSSCSKILGSLRGTPVVKSIPARELISKTLLPTLRGWYPLSLHGGLAHHFDGPHSAPTGWSPLKRVEASIASNLIVLDAMYSRGAGYLR